MTAQHLSPDGAAHLGDGATCGRHGCYRPERQTPAEALDTLRRMLDAPPVPRDREPAGPEDPRIQRAEDARDFPDHEPDWLDQI